jgi:hypothetical protein
LEIDCLGRAETDPTSHQHESNLAVLFKLEKMIYATNRLNPYELCMDINTLAHITYGLSSQNTFYVCGK